MFPFTSWKPGGRASPLGAVFYATRAEKPTNPDSWKAMPGQAQEGL